jgi:hypothetical protein
MFQVNPIELKVLRHLQKHRLKPWVMWRDLHPLIGPVAGHDQKDVANRVERLINCGYVVVSRSRTFPDDDHYMITHAGLRLMNEVDQT